MTVSPGVRAPRAWLQVLSAYLPTAEIEATVNTKKSSGTYSAVIPMDTATQMGIDLYTLSDEPTITASVFINQDANTSGPVNLISGPLDEIEFDFERQILQFKGRDQSSDLHDTKNHEKFLNQTASQIVNTIAGRHGLTPQIDDTTGMVGRALRQDFAKLTDGMSDWSLVQKLAEIEGASCYAFRRAIAGRFGILGVPTRPACRSRSAERPPARRYRSPKGAVAGRDAGRRGPPSRSRCRGIFPADR